MHPSAYDLKSFYNSARGRIVRRILRARVADFWPDTDTKALRVLGVGYAVPYLASYMDKAERVVCVMPSGQGAHGWPSDGENLVCLSDETALPFETNSVDRILMVHSLEFSGFLTPEFEELWRVLKSNGRLLMIVPNRMGMWARADWSPFGQGTPFSARQVELFLRENLFVHERTEKALFVPPFRRDFFLRAAGYFEEIGRMLFPAMGGVHFVEASKQLYAGTGQTQRSLALKRIRKSGLEVPEAARREKL
ncbi:MAG: methyltransferase domain-containing protein [Rhodospirillales bacterium]|nr:methyltransferase domain-containing protein [Alphaproteobacteria bacterium]USO03144.1 MAG: methyltransferase domain-containing protein [Rhodospirillales bacterium]